MRVLVELRGHVRHVVNSLLLDIGEGLVLDKGASLGSLVGKV